MPPGCAAAACCFFNLPRISRISLTRSRSFSQRAFSAGQLLFGRAFCLPRSPPAARQWSAPRAASRSSTRACTARSSSVRCASSMAGGSGVLAQREPRAGRIEHADRFVGQLPVGQVAVRELHRRGQPLVEDAHVVVLFEHGTTPRSISSHLASVGLLHLHHLEAARQRRVLLEVLLVFGPRGGRDGAQFAARQRRLQQVGGVVLPGLAAGADHGVRFVDEQDDRRGRGLHFVDQPLQPVLEFALDARAGLQQRQVERADGDVAQRRRHVALRRCAARSPPPRRSCPRPLRR